MSHYVRRTTADLVAELHETAATNDRAALVVGFDDRTEFVWASDPDALLSLNTHVRNGGDPLGVVTGQSLPPARRAPARCRSPNGYCRPASAGSRKGMVRSSICGSCAAQ